MLPTNALTTRLSGTSKRTMLFVAASQRSSAAASAPAASARRSRASACAARARASQDARARVIRIVQGCATARGPSCARQQSRRGGSVRAVPSPGTLARGAPPRADSSGSAQLEKRLSCRLSGSAQNRPHTPPTPAVCGRCCRQSVAGTQGTPVGALTRARVAWRTTARKTRGRSPARCSRPTRRSQRSAVPPTSAAARRGSSSARAPPSAPSSQAWPPPPACCSPPLLVMLVGSTPTARAGGRDAERALIVLPDRTGWRDPALRAALTRSVVGPRPNRLMCVQRRRRLRLY